MLKEIKTEYQHYFVNVLNQKQGEYKSYHHNGDLQCHCHYVNGDRHGEFKEYYHTGNLRIQCHYINDNLHGEYKEYYQNGNLYHATFHYQGKDLHVNPNTLTQKDKTYIMMSGRLPQRD